LAIPPPPPVLRRDVIGKSGCAATIALPIPRNAPGTALPYEGVPTVLRQMLLLQ